MTSENDSPNPYQSPEDTAAQDAPLVRDFAYRKRRQLVFLLVAMGMSGFLSGFTAEGSGGERIIDLVGGLVAAVLIRAIDVPYEPLGKPWPPGQG